MSSLLHGAADGFVEARTHAHPLSVWTGREHLLCCDGIGCDGFAWKLLVRDFAATTASCAALRGTLGAAGAEGPDARGVRRPSLDCRRSSGTGTQEASLAIDGFSALESTAIRACAGLVLISVATVAAILPRLEGAERSISVAAGCGGELPQAMCSSGAFSGG